MSKIPGFVPLPEVNKYTEAIHVGELGLPVGFDTERLELHIGRTARLARLGDIEHTSISGFRGGTTDYSFGVGGISNDGIGTAVRNIAVAKTKLTEVDIESSKGPLNYRWGHAEVRVNNAEIEERLKAQTDKWELGVFDPKGRAKLMDKAIRHGLCDAAYEVILESNPPKVLTRSLILQGMDTAFVLATIGDQFEYNVKTAAVVGYGMKVALRPLNNFLIQQYAKTEGRELPARQWSLFQRDHYDRYVAHRALSATTRLVRART